MFGPALHAGPTTLRERLGVDAVLPRDEFTRRRRPRSRRERRTIYTPFARRGPRQPVVRAIRRGCWRGATKEDPWDGRDSREADVHREAEGGGADVGGQGSRPDSRRAARDQEPARDRHHPRGDAHRRPRHHGSDARRPAGHARVRAAGRRRVRVQEVRRATAPSYFALIATGPNTYYTHYHKNTAMLAGRRPRAVRLRARLQVLPVRRHARVSGQRQVHAAAARVLHDLPAALSGADDVDQGARDAGRHRSATPS